MKVYWLLLLCLLIGIEAIGKIEESEKEKCEQYEAQVILTIRSIEPADIGYAVKLEYKDRDDQINEHYLCPLSRFLDRSISFTDEQGDGLHAGDRISGVIVLQTCSFSLSQTISYS